jgi:hypothetical protein
MHILQLVQCGMAVHYTDRQVRNDVLRNVNTAYYTANLKYIAVNSLLIASFEGLGEQASNRSGTPSET